MLTIIQLQIHFSNRANQKTRLAHRGFQGNHCQYADTIQPLIYAVLNEPPLMDLFRQSSYNTASLSFGTPDQSRLDVWLVQAVSANRPIINLLTLVEFIIALRGLPVPCRTLEVCWD